MLQRTREEADNVCRASQMQLVSIESKKEEEEVGSLMAENRKTFVYKLRVCNDNNLMHDALQK